MSSNDGKGLPGSKDVMHSSRSSQNNHGDYPTPEEQSTLSTLSSRIWTHIGAHVVSMYSLRTRWLFSLRNVHGKYWPRFCTAPHVGFWTGPLYIFPIVVGLHPSRLAVVGLLPRLASQQSTQARVRNALKPGDRRFGVSVGFSQTWHGDATNLSCHSVCGLRHWGYIL